MQNGSYYGESVAQQLLGYGRSGIIFIGISASGNNENIINVAVVVKASNNKVI